MKRALSLLASMAMGACGGSGGVSSSASVSGNVHGNPVQTSNAISGNASFNNNGQMTQVGAILISNDGQLCADAGANKQPKNAQLLFLGLADVSNGAFSVPVAAGDYQVYVSGSGSPPAKIALAQYIRTDATCQTQQAQSALAASGVVHLTGVSNGAYTGTFDLTVAETDASGNATSTTDHLTGSFNGASCAALNGALNSGTNTTCY
jgi:hypothetical protein